MSVTKLTKHLTNTMCLTLDIKTKLHRRINMFCFALVIKCESPIEVHGRVITTLAATTLGLVFNIHSLS